MHLDRAGNDRWMLGLAALLHLVVAAVLGCEQEAAVAPVSGPPQQETAVAPASAPPQPRPHRSLTVRVTGGDYKWLIRYPGPDGTLDTPDDVLTRRHLHLPADTQVAVDLQSQDYVYSFYVPYLHLMEVAVPDIPFELKFETESPGTHELLGSQMCGYTHPDLIGDVVVHAPHDFNTWLAEVRGRGLIEQDRLGL